MLQECRRIFPGDECGWEIVRLFRHSLPGRE